VAERGGPMIRWHCSSFDGSDQPYALYVPASYDTSRPWPLVISLHGYSSDHIQNLRRVMGKGAGEGESEAECKTVFPSLPDIDMLIASPYGFGSLWYEGAAETEVLDVIADVRAHYNIDPDRIYLTGLSMGGYGTIKLASRHPDLFAAIAPVCPPTDFRFFETDNCRSTSFGEDLQVAYCVVNTAANLKYVPAKFFHGDADPVVPVKHSRVMVKRMKELGCKVEYVEFPGVQHNAWTPAYADLSVLRWFEQFKRVEQPSQVVYSTPSLRWPGAYWVRIRQIENRPHLAAIKAIIEDGRTINVSTSNVSSFSLRLDLAPVIAGDNLAVLWNGLEVLRGRPDGMQVSFGVTGSGLVKKAGLEGPINDAFRDRYLLVYGTHGTDTELLTTAREAAEKAADPGEWGDIEIPVKPDAEVTDDDIQIYNLVLFGNPQTNRLISLVNDELPVRFEGSWVRSGRRLLTGDDMGLMVVYPNPMNRNRYVVVLGGSSPETLRMAASNHGLAPDYVVFDSESDFSNERTLRDWGYFGNDWEHR